MSQDPSPYDLLQDSRIEGVEELVHPYYQPPSETEHSFPVVGQGVTSEMYQQMSLAQGSGVLIRDGAAHPYVLRNLPGGVSETNARNQMVLKVAENTGRAEAIIAGFYHVLYQDMIIDLPPVTTNTSYWICLTYDPRREEEATGPIRVEVHTNDLPRTHGRQHIILHEVYRRPNMLLTDAGIEMHRHYISPTITARSVGSLPDPTDVNYGSLGIVRNGGTSDSVHSGTGGIFESRGGYGWHNLLTGPWEDMDFLYGGWSASRAAWRVKHDGVDVVFRANKDGTLDNGHRPFRLPSRAHPNLTFRASFFATERTNSLGVIEINTEGDAIILGGRIQYGWVDINLFIPDYFYS